MIIPSDFLFDYNTAPIKSRRKIKFPSGGRFTLAYQAKTPACSNTGGSFIILRARR
jgi:hypothetical protein